jgi:hypothetical protein
MTARDTRPEPVVCGYREQRTTGTWECVKPVDCDGGHYLVRLVSTGAAS